MLEKAEGEATYKQKVFLADGGLLPKLASFNEAVKDMANAYKERKTPTVQMGGSSKTGDTEAMDFMDMIKAKFALDLSLDNKVIGTHVPVK